MTYLSNHEINLRRISETQYRLKLKDRLNTLKSISVLSSTIADMEAVSTSGGGGVTEKHRVGRRAVGRVGYIPLLPKNHDLGMCVKRSQRQRNVNMEASFNHENVRAVSLE
jgi:hypothetical protein